MPIGTANSPSIKALGLALVAAFTLLIIESANGISATDRFATVNVQQESSHAAEPERVSTEGKETKSDRSKFASQSQEPNADPKIESIDWLLLDLNMGVSAREIKIEDYVLTEARIIDLQNRVIRKNFTMLRSLKSQLPKSQTELEQARQKFGLNHPLTNSTEAKIKMIEQFLEKIIDENSDLTISEKSSRDNKRVKAFFWSKPTHPEDKYSQPSFLNEIVLTRTKSQLGYEATDSQGNLLCRFVDTNLDYCFDTWIYFKHGRETSRETDRTLTK